MADEQHRSIVEQAKSLWAKLSMAKRATLVGAVAATVAGIAWVTSRPETPAQAVLFSGLPAEEAGAIVAELDVAKVPYRLDHAGSTILVPADRVDALRLQLATSGYPKGGGYGFEGFEARSKLGDTKFTEEKSYQRALSGELSRSITTLAAVDRARVILAIPDRSLFTKNPDAPSASVVLKLKNGRELGPKQVKGIVHLVASAVERLRPDRVSVVDETGNVLWSGDEHADADVAQRDLERTLTRRISDLTRRLVGQDRAVVSVTSELDHSRTERTEETYDRDRAAVRSTSRSEELVQAPNGANVAPAIGGTGGGGGGLAGVRGNLPGSASATESASTPSGTERKKVTETTNNEISRVVAVTHGPRMQLKRLHVAVLLDGELALEGAAAAAAAQVPVVPVAASTVTSSTAVAVVPPVKKKTRVWTKAQLDQIAALAREAAGLDPARGDRIEVHCAPFHEEEVAALPPPPPVPVWRAKLEEHKLWVAAAVAGLGLLVAAVVAVVIIRRRRREVLEPIAMPALPLRAAEVDQALAGELPAPVIEPVPALPDPRTVAMDAAKADPARAARILSAWLSESMPAGPTPPHIPEPTSHATEGVAR